MIHVLSYLPGSGDDCLPSVSYLNQGLLIPAFSITTRKRPLNIKHRFTPMPQQMSSFTWRTIHITFCHECLTVACDDVKSVTFILFLNRKDSQATRTARLFGEELAVFARVFKLNVTRIYYLNHSCSSLVWHVKGSTWDLDLKAVTSPRITTSYKLLRIFYWCVTAIFLVYNYDNKLWPKPTDYTGTGLLPGVIRHFELSNDIMFNNNKDWKHRAGLLPVHDLFCFLNELAL